MLVDITNSATCSVSTVNSAVMCTDLQRPLLKPTENSANQSEPAPPELTNQSGRPSTSIGDFHYVKTIGTGFFGRVILARHKLSESHHALKVMKKAEVVKKGQAKRVLNEKRILQALKFPFIVGLNNAFQDSANLYLVLEYVDGGDFYAYLRKWGRATEEVVRFVAAQLCLAVEFLHFHCVVHRDLKPENILLDSRGYVKLTDFGLARVLPHSSRAYSRCGTLDYLAPEVLTGHGYGKGIDWWALGVCIAEAIAGINPFAGRSQQETYENIISCRLRLPNWFSPCLVDVISKLLQPNEQFRHGSQQHCASAADIRKHRWFANFDWSAVYGQLAPSPLTTSETFFPGHDDDDDQKSLELFHDHYGEMDCNSGCCLLNSHDDVTKNGEQFDQYFVNF